MTDVVLKKLNGEYTKKMVKRTYEHKVILGSEDLCEIFNVENTTRWEFSGYSSSYHRGEDGITVLTAYNRGCNISYTKNGGDIVTLRWIEAENVREE